MGLNAGATISALVLTAVLAGLFLYVLYVVIRAAVRDGVNASRLGAPDSTDNDIDSISS